MSYVHNNLMPGEDVLKEAKVHWFIYAPSVVILLASFLMGDARGPNMLILAIGLVFLAQALSIALGTEFAVTSRRIIAKHGIVVRRTIEVNLSKVESLGVDQGVFGRVFNYGSLTINGTGGSHAPFNYVDRPLEFRAALNEALEKSGIRA